MRDFGASGIFFLLFLIPTAVVLYGLVDAARRPHHSWTAAGENKTLWIALQAAGLMLSLLGMVLTIVYLGVIRPRVADAAHASRDAG